MVALITGGSGSGKSEFAENLAVKLKGSYEAVYIATMYPYGEETLQKIQRHKEMRAGKGFETLECFYGLQDIAVPLQSTVLLECMSNLLANELYMEEGAKENAVTYIMDGILRLAQQAENLIIVSNEVFGDIANPDPEMVNYIQQLGVINQEIGKMADVICEVVYSIPIYHKKV